MWCIETCRTVVLGGHLDECLDCGHEEPSYNSCRNRHCPKCQALAQARWLEKQQKRILPISYFHVVFTLPAELKPLALRNRKQIFDILFTTASKTLLELGRDPKRLGALLGFTAVLHTWTRDLRFHPHLHCVVTGGGLALDSNHWRHSSRKFLFPVKVIGRLFRGKFVAALKRLYQKRNLDLGDDNANLTNFDKLQKKLFTKNWVVYAKRPFAGPEQVFTYLGQYTHRVAISNHRILSITSNSIIIVTRDGNTATIKPHQFIRRFLQHVLPKGFVKIRHYGLMASSNIKIKLKTARLLLESCAHTGDGKPKIKELPADWQQLLKELTGIDLSVCPRCGSKKIRRVIIPKKKNKSPRAREPP